MSNQSIFKYYKLFLMYMDLFMFLQMTTSFQCLDTYITRICFFPCMYNFISIYSLYLERNVFDIHHNYNTLIIKELEELFQSQQAKLYLSCLYYYQYKIIQPINIKCIQICPPPLSPVTAVIEVQTKKHPVKHLK